MNSLVVFPAVLVGASVLLVATTVLERLIGLSSEPPLLSPHPALARDDGAGQEQQQ
jgi:hypothetical protein